MEKRVFFLHTVSNLYTMFNELSEQYIPTAKRTHISDESLIQRALQAGGLTADIEGRLLENILAAEKAGADFIQVTCSSMTPAVKKFRDKVRVPLLSIDEPIAGFLVSNYKRIGVIATASSTLNPSTKLVKETAKNSGKNIQVVSKFCEGAYEAFFAGNMKKHDQIVKNNLLDLMNKVDVILLAQASMARVAGLIPEKEKIVPVETSPEYAMEHLSNLINDNK